MSSGELAKAIMVDLEMIKPIEHRVRGFRPWPASIIALANTLALEQPPLSKET